MKLAIVESPNKVKKIQSFLGAGWTVAASVGHIRDLPQKEIGVAVPDFQPTYELTERGADVAKRLKELAAKSESVVLATDPDREGEAIGWHVAQVLGLKNPDRVEFHEITAAAVAKAIANPRKLDLALIRAQEARRVLDRLVGYLVSPKLGKGLSAGRVQSPALWLVVQREREILSHLSKKHFGARLSFGQWNAEWDFSKQLSAGEKLWTDRAAADAAAQVRSLRVASCTESHAKSAPPAPFTTSTLQQAASVRLGMNPKRAMEVAQALFAAGAITYHRTDSQNLSDEAIIAIRSLAPAKGYPLPDEPRRWKSKEGAQEAHEAIRPTHFEQEAVGADADEQRLYKLIWERAVACQLADAEYDVRTVDLESADGLCFIARGRKMAFIGWRCLTDTDATDEDESSPEATNPVPQLAQGDAVEALAGEVLEKTTKAAPRYTQASLVKALEAHGIGRPSTYAAILDNISTRFYIEETAKKLKPTALGVQLIEALEAGKFSFLQLDFTREMEARLDQVAAGTAEYLPTVSAAHSVLAQELVAFAPAIDRAETGEVVSCPDCAKPMRRINGAKGFFWSCTGYHDGSCKKTLPDKNGKPDLGVSCPTCKTGALRQITGAKGKFWGCSGYRDGSCKATFPDKRGKPDFAVQARK